MGNLVVSFQKLWQSRELHSNSKLNQFQKIITVTFAVSLFAADSVVVSAKPHTSSNISKVGGVRAKAVIRDNHIDNHFVSHDASNLGNLLIRGKSYPWNSFRDVVYSSPSEESLGEYFVDPSMAPISGNGKANKYKCYFFGAESTLSGASNCLTAAGN